MIIDGHAHACGNFSDAESTITYLRRHHIDKVILCPGEPNSKIIYSVPMISNFIQNSNLGYFFNIIIFFLVKLKGITKHMDQQNQIIGEMAKRYPAEIIQAYLINPLDKDCIIKMERDFLKYHFQMLKLHQCWNKFDVDSENFSKIIDWATEKHLPIFIHLFSKNQSIQFAKLTNQFLSTNFIVAHLIGLEEIIEFSINPNIYFDISAPQLISKKRLEQAISVLGSSRLILGSDAPYGRKNLEINLHLLDQFSFSEQEKQNITGKNITQLLQIL